METVRIITDARGVSTLTLARSEKHNAMSAQMIADLTEAVRLLAADATVRAVVLAADGPTFCAGGDLGWMRDQMAADAATRRAAAMQLAAMLGALNSLPKPLIGRVQGNAYGGGIGLMSVCDVVVATDTAMFGLTETRLGLIPATIGPYVIARMGAAMARRVFMSSRKFGAAEAQTLGLVAQVVQADALDAAIAAEVAPYLDCAPGAVAAAKLLALRLGAGIDDAAVSDSIDALVAQWEGTEAAEGIAAFFEKRKPRWAS